MANSEKYDNAETLEVGIETIGASNRTSPWQFYNTLIDAIPEDIFVIDYCIGMHWTYITTTQGTGMSYTTKGGSRRSHIDCKGMSLKKAAELVKSWCFEEASLGIAALNSWFSQKDKLEALGATFNTTLDAPQSQNDTTTDAFEYYRSQIAGKNVAMIGHFPNAEHIAEYTNLTVLERNCTRDLDTPDPACEYVLPAQDFVFLTGVTITNKTAPRLLELCDQARTIFVGPSVIPSSSLFERGIEMIAGSFVYDPEQVMHAVKSGDGKMFGNSLQKFLLCEYKE